MKKEKNIVTRIKMIKAMEFICRQINDETVFYDWLMLGVADGDINPGDLSVNAEDLENLEYYCEDDTFADLMATFLSVMKDANDDGLYCDNIISGEKFEF